MNERRLLLENALDALDRLFDREASVVGVYAITYATSQALREDMLFAVLREAAAALREVLRAGLDASEERKLALVATDKLRHALAEAVD